MLCPDFAFSQVLVSPIAITITTPTIPAAEATTIPASSTAAVPTPIASATSPGAIFLARLLGRPAFEYGLSGQPDLALGIDIRHHDGDLIAHADDIFNSVHPLAIQL